MIWYPYHSCYTFQASYQHNAIALYTKKQSFFWHTCIHLLIVICLFCLCLSTTVIIPNFLTNWHVDLNPSHFPPHHGHSCLSLLYVSCYSVVTGFFFIYLVMKYRNGNNIYELNNKEINRPSLNAKHIAGSCCLMIIFKLRVKCRNKTTFKATKWWKKSVRLKYCYLEHFLVFD